MSCRRIDRAVDQCPAPVDAARQKCGILVFRLHDDAEALKLMKVFREGERHARTTARVGCVHHRILSQFRDVCNPRIFDPPIFLREMFRIGRQRGLGIDLPVVEAVRRTSRGQVGQPAPILHAA